MTSHGASLNRQKRWYIDLHASDDASRLRADHQDAGAPHTAILAQVEPCRIACRKTFILYAVMCIFQ